MNADKRGWSDAAENELSEAILGAAYAVSNSLGAGFLEKVYENALAHELRKMGMRIDQQACLQVVYDGVVVGEYVADLIVEGRVLVELKAVKEFDDVHRAQVLNYLKATNLKLGLLLNFGTPKVGVCRLRRG
jgi:GxxExxY protein